MKNIWKLQKKSVIEPERGQRMEISALLSSHWVTMKKPLSILKNVWKFQIGDQTWERRAYGSLVNAYQSLGDYGKAIEYEENHSKIAKEISDWAGEGRAYGYLDTV